MEKKLKMMCVISSITLLFIATPSAHSGLLHIDNNEIDVFGTVWNSLYPPENTIDDNLSTFWHGTNDIQIGMTNYLAYRFNNLYNIRQIDFTNDAQNSYQLGELEIQVSQNSTDGSDGDWTTIDQVPGSFDPSGGDFTRFVVTGPTSWIRLWMTYQGEGAYGITPAFYLTEIDFYAVSEAVIDIDPDTLNLNSKGKWIT